jgi:hypothetical protein
VVTVTAGCQQLPVYLDGETTKEESDRSYKLSDGMITAYQPGVYNP